MTEQTAIALAKIFEHQPKYTEDCIIIRHSPHDAPKLQVVQFKTGGLAKGETILATLCGGTMGKVLACAVAQQAMQMTMIDVYVSEIGE